MFFRIPNRLGYPVDRKRSDIIHIAYGRVMGYKMTPSVQLLSQYLENTIKKDLKTYCKELVATKLKITSGVDNDSFLVTFVDEDSNKTAKLITYGNSEIQGCDILRFAFNQNY